MTNPISWLSDDGPSPDILTEEMRRDVCREDGTLHRLYQALAPWPSAILPVHKFYQAILHAPDAPLDLHSAEFVATHVAILNDCAYARAHHGANYCATTPDRAAAEAELAALERDDLQSEALSDRQRAIATYTRKLSQTPGAMRRSDVEALARAGLRADEILHVNQIAASFGYWTRMINGLGISLGDEDVGLGASTLAGITGGQVDG